MFDFRFYWQYLPISWLSHVEGEFYVYTRSCDIWMMAQYEQVRTSNVHNMGVEGVVPKDIEIE